MMSGRAFAWLVGSVWFVLLIECLFAFNPSHFRKCSEISFCRRNRALVPGILDSAILRSSLTLDGSSVEGGRVEGSILRGDVICEALQVNLTFELHALPHATVRFVVDEKKYEGPDPRLSQPPEWDTEEDGVWQPEIITRPLKERFIAKEVLLPSHSQSGLTCTLSQPSNNDVVLDCTTYSVHLQLTPLLLELIVGQKIITKLNSLGLFHFEAFEEKTKGLGITSPELGKAFKDIDHLKDLWEESFGAYTDAKPFGPSSVGTDIAFPSSSHLYGLPERTRLFLQQTRRFPSASEEQPYRLFNLDVHEYEVQESISLYGVVPFVMALLDTSCPATNSCEEVGAAGVFWFNPSETFVDVWYDEQPSKTAYTHWFSETGRLDVFLFAGNTPNDVLKSYSDLTGRLALPTTQAISYHQCRWNYNNEDDVLAVDEGFDDNAIPYDYLWLDLEHTDNHKYFTWDKNNFPSPVEMQEDLSKCGRRMVVLTDPHIKVDNDYVVYSSAKEAKVFVGGSVTMYDEDKQLEKKKRYDIEYKEFEGDCWPGKSSWIDMLTPAGRKFWADLFKKHPGSTKYLDYWIDMNEPSVFNSPEVTFPRDVLHIGGGSTVPLEHREVHNAYGFYMALATYDGLRRSRPNQRPFMLTRSFFAGSQRYAAVWTGDNAAQWQHLAATTKLLLAMSISGISFVGSDIGGFFGNPEPDLLVRWYQAGAFHPFFRGHSHHDAKRREPWLFGEPYTSFIRQAITTRYKLLPYMYTLFYQASSNFLKARNSSKNNNLERFNQPILLRPLWYSFPRDENTYLIEDSFMLGEHLLVKPITSATQYSTDVYLPEGLWYPLVLPPEVPQSLPIIKGPTTVHVETPLDKIPVFFRGGGIIPVKGRIRRASLMMRFDPVTLLVALDSSMRAEGMFLLDNGGGWGDQEWSGNTTREYVVSVFSFHNNVIHSQVVLQSPQPKSVTNTQVERIVIMGLRSCPVQAVLASSHHTIVHHECISPNVAVLRRPDINMKQNWTIALEFS